MQLNQYKEALIQMLMQQKVSDFTITLSMKQMEVRCLVLRLLTIRLTENIGRDRIQESIRM